jgi:hypothetical protein
MVMHPPRTAALAAALWLALAIPPAPAVLAQTRPAAPDKVRDVLDQARQRLARRDAPGAAALIEAALPAAGAADRPALLGLLRQAYDAAARQAEAAGKTDEAAEYRENLAILDRKVHPAGEPVPANSTPAPAPTPAPRELAPDQTASGSRVVVLPTHPPVDAAVTRVTEDPRRPSPPAVSGPAPSTAVERSLPTKPSAGSLVAGTPTPAAASPPAAIPTPAATPAPVPAAVAGPAGQSASTSPTGAGSEVSVTSADQAFLAKRYDMAGAIYAVLFRRNALPADRRDHWAYCRAVDVVRRINARPTTPEEWAAIDAEIEQIRRLSPSNWFAEYLRNRAAERNPGGRASRTLRANNMVVRGSSPEEPPTAAPVAPPPTPPSQAPLPPLPPPGPVQAPAPAPAPSPSAGPVRWSPQPVYSTNFQVVFAEGQRDLAEQVARAAESARAALVKRWGDPNPGVPWSPRCEVILFPTAAEFSRATGQPPESPGISTMRMTDGRIDGRRINLRADHSNVVKAVLPHEVTHVVLADLFPHKQIPRWADEGIAVLSEPTYEQSVRAADLNEPLAAGRLFRLNDLVTMDYPDPRYLSLYYSQSVSLTRFLVEQGTTARFVQFVQQAQWSGFEPALEKVYAIHNFGDLQTRWLTFAKERSSPTLTATAERNTATPPARASR